MFQIRIIRIIGIQTLDKSFSSLIQIASQTSKKSIDWVITCISKKMYLLVESMYSQCTAHMVQLNDFGPSTLTRQRLDSVYKLYVQSTFFLNARNLCLKEIFINLYFALYCNLTIFWLFYNFYPTVYLLARLYPR